MDRTGEERKNIHQTDRHPVDERASSAAEWRDSMNSQRECCRLGGSLFSRVIGIVQPQKHNHLIRIFSTWLVGWLAGWLVVECLSTSIIIVSRVVSETLYLCLSYIGHLGGIMKTPFRGIS